MLSASTYSNSANTGPLLLLQQPCHVSGMVSLKCTAIIIIACVSLFENMPLPTLYFLAAAVQLEDLLGLCSLYDVCYNFGRKECAIVILPLAPIAFSAE